MIRSMEFMPLPNPFPTGAVIDDATTALIVGVVGIVGVLLAGVSTLATYRRNKRMRLAAIPLNDKLARAVELSVELSTLNAQVQSEFDLQIAEARAAQEELRHAQALASFTAEQKAAAARSAGAHVAAEFKKNGARDRWFQFGLSLGMFILGAIASLVLPGLFVDESTGSDASPSFGAFEQAIHVTFNVV